jgi:hypothetical protein
MTIGYAVLIGLLTGTMGTTGVFLWIQKKQDPTEQVLQNQGEVLKDLAEIQMSIHQGELDIKKNLTSTDLLQVSCSQDWMADHGPLLCREMFCRLQTREGDGASQVECEQIANLANSLTMIKECQDTGIQLEECVGIVGKRK